MLNRRQALQRESNMITKERGESIEIKVKSLYFTCCCCCCLRTSSTGAPRISGKGTRMQKRAVKSVRIICVKISKCWVFNISPTRHVFTMPTTKGNEKKPQEIASKECNVHEAINGNQTLRLNEELKHLTGENWKHAQELWRGYKEEEGEDYRKQLQTLPQLNGTRKRCLKSR